MSNLTKLHLCCGGRILSGWRNTDQWYYDQCEIFDLLKLPWSVPSESCSHIYCEQGIEHFEIQDTRKILNECYRVLNKGGKIRLVTPDLVNLVTLNRFQEMQPEVSSRYPQMPQEIYSQHMGPLNESPDATTYCIVLNQYMRAWGHKFFWDFDSLKGVLQTVGFTDLKKEKFYSSVDPELRNLEKYYSDNSYKPLYDFESFVIEGTK